MTTPRSRPPVAVGETLAALLAHLDPKGNFRVAQLVKRWPEIAGDQIARRTEIAALKFHTAIVKVSNPMWIQELNLMRPQILSRVNASMRNDAVREIRFVQGRLSRRERKDLRVLGRGARRPIQLPELEDTELQRAFESLIEAWGRSPR